ncbi:MAG: SpoVR family protein [Candidatus Blackburnbacteria bacterium]|nr:SpoVR family protein [Candidatus Blackburnbacteria bacterium]
MTQERLPELRPENISEAELLRRRVEAIAEIAQEQGLAPFPVNFEIVPAAIMYEFGSYGIPGRYSHWTHGKAYHQVKTMYDYGLSKIYELVVNNNPAWAFLLENNGVLQNTLVAAHVVAHVDFFKNNPAFKDTNRQMINGASLNSERVRRYELEHGSLEVERFLDDVLAIEANIDPAELKRPSPEQYVAQAGEEFKRRQRQRRREATDYDDLLELGQPKKDKPGETKAPVPLDEEQDLLYFIRARSPKPLEPWQEDIIDIVRVEGQYFLPQARTKIMNEGWAVYWHVRILREMEEKGLLLPGEEIAWREMHAGVASPGRNRINPYYIGWKVFEDITRRYEGRAHPDGKKQKTWWGEEIDPQATKGKPEYNVFWVREMVSSDQAFLAEYLTLGLIKELDLYVYEYTPQTREWKITEKDPQKVKDRLVRSMTNFGLPVIKVAPGGEDYNGNRELYLVHKIDADDEGGQKELDIPWAERTLASIHRLWGRPVHLETVIGGERILLSYTGEEKGHTRTKLTA